QRNSSTRGSHRERRVVVAYRIGRSEQPRTPWHAATAADGCGRPLARARPSRPSTRGAQAPRYSVEYIYPVMKAHVAAQVPGRYGHISCCKLTRAKVNGGTP